MDNSMGKLVYTKDDINEYLPVGSVVILKGAIQRVMIVSRAVKVPYDGKQKFFDYGACPYPVGIINDQLAYFNAEDIARLYFKGYSSDDDEILVESIKEAKKQNNIE